MAPADDELIPAARSTAAAEFPLHNIRGIRVCATEPHRTVVRVFLEKKEQKKKIWPTPYVIYAIDHAKLKVERLTGPASKPYEIRIYK